MEWLTPRPINSSSLRKVLPVPPLTKPNIEYTFCCCWFYFVVIKIKSALSLCEKYDFIAIDWSKSEHRKTDRKFVENRNEYSMHVNGIIIK